MTRLGLALGAGGARGLAHVGVLAALERAGVRPDVVAGTSMGAIVGALWAETRDAAEVARRLDSYTGDPQFVATWRPFLPDDENHAGHGAHAMLGELHRIVQRKVVSFRTLTSPAQQRAERLLDPLGRLFRTRRLEELPIPFAAVSADLRSGELVTFTSGDLVRAIYASSAIPGVFPPLAEGGALLVDGGGPARIPIRACRRLGADFVLAVDIPSFQPDEAEYRTGFDVILRADAITRQRLAERVLREADLVVTPDVDEFHWAAFGQAPRIRAAGEAAMDAALPALRAALARREGAGHRIRRAVESWWTDLVSGDEPSPR